MRVVLKLWEGATIEHDVPFPEPPETIVVPVLGTAELHFARLAVHGTPPAYALVLITMDALPVLQQLARKLEAGEIAWASPQEDTDGTEDRRTEKR